MAAAAENSAEQHAIVSQTMLFVLLQTHYTATVKERKKFLPGSSFTTPRRVER